MVHRRPPRKARSDHVANSPLYSIHQAMRGCEPLPSVTIIERVYSYEPVLTSLTREVSTIIGAQANLWTSTSRRQAGVHGLPRALAWPS